MNPSLFPSTSFRLKLSTIALLIVGVLLGVFPASLAIGSPPPGTYYLALGDSLAYGASAAGVPVDPTCASPTAFGYVCLVYRYLKQQQPSLQLQNLAVPEEDSCELLHGYGGGSPCTRVLPAPIDAPLPRALKFLTDHPGAVNPITINIGGNDLLPLLPDAAAHPLETAAQLPKVFSAFTQNLDSTLSQLRIAAGPNTTIIVINQYNPLGGIASPPLPSGLPEVARSAIDGMNRIVQSEATKSNASYVDVSAAFDAAPGGASVLTFVPPTLASGDPTKLNILPTTDGYRTYAGAVIRSSGFLTALSVKGKLTPRSIRTGKRIRITGKTSVFSNLTFTITSPAGKKRTLQGAANEVGAFSASVKVAKTKGMGRVRVCAVDLAGQRSCGGTMTYHAT